MKRGLVVAMVSFLAIGCGDEFVGGPSPTPPVVSPPEIPTGITTSSRLPSPGDPGLPQVSRIPQDSEPPPSYVLDVAAGGSLTVSLAQMPAMTTYSVEMWVNLAREVDQTIAASRNFRLQIRDQRLRVRVGDTELRGRRLQATHWYHVAVVVEEGRRARLYVNGSLVTTASLPTVDDDVIGGVFVVGPTPRGREYEFAGRIDNLRVISTPLTTFDRFRPNVQLSPADGVVFAFNFDSGEAPGERVAASNGDYVGELQPGALIVAGSL